MTSLHGPHIGTIAHKKEKLLHGHLSLPPPLSGLQSHVSRVKLL